MRKTNGINTIFKSTTVKYYFFMTAKKVYCTILMDYRQQIRVLAGHRPVFATLIGNSISPPFLFTNMAHGHGG